MSVDGRWRVVVDSQAGKHTAVLDLHTEGTQVSGAAEWEGGTIELRNGQLDGNRLTFEMKIRKPMPMKVTFSLTVEGDTMTGDMKPGFFPRQPVSGERA